MSSTAMIRHERLAKPRPNEQGRHYSAHLLETVEGLYYPAVQQSTIHSLWWIVRNCNSANQRIEGIRECLLRPRIVAALSDTPHDMVSLPPVIQEGADQRRRVL